MPLSSALRWQWESLEYIKQKKLSDCDNDELPCKVER